MPATPQDARDLLIASVLSDDPVLYIDDRWLYEVTQEVSPIIEKDLRVERPASPQSRGQTARWPRPAIPSSCACAPPISCRTEASPVKW